MRRLSSLIAGAATLAFAAIGPPAFADPPNMYEHTIPTIYPIDFAGAAVAPVLNSTAEPIADSGGAVVSPVLMTTNRQVSILPRAALLINPG